MQYFSKSQLSFYHKKSSFSSSMTLDFGSGGDTSLVTLWRLTFPFQGDGGRVLVWRGADSRANEAMSLCRDEDKLCGCGIGWNAYCIRLGQGWQSQSRWFCSTLDHGERNHQRNSKLELRGKLFHSVIQNFFNKLHSALIHIFPPLFQRASARAPVLNNM